MKRPTAVFHILLFSRLKSISHELHVFIGGESLFFMFAGLQDQLNAALHFTQKAAFFH